MSITQISSANQAQAVPSVGRVKEGVHKRLLIGTSMDMRRATAISHAA
jgi:hypothetical protein